MHASSRPPFRKLIFIELNEINFDIAAQYVARGDFPSLKKLLDGPSIRTRAEDSYEKLEPWIQWPSVHCGMTADEHGIFRLGDIVHSTVPQFFEKVEAMGIPVGVVSAMNAANRLQRPLYFIPDPWTKTPTDGSRWSRTLLAAVSQAVNDNAQHKVTPRSAIDLLLGLVRFARPKHYATYLRLALSSRNAPWRKALFLDLFLHDIHLKLYKARRPGFSTLFLNAGAHIQHHYFFNAKVLPKSDSLRNPSWYVRDSVDPIAEMLGIYDLVIQDYLEVEDAEIVIATGLSQRPYDRVKYYYRLRDHGKFMEEIGLHHRAVHPRMTRDFLIEFDTVEQALRAQNRLEELHANDGQRLFGEIDNRGASLFVTLTYPSEIADSTSFSIDGKLTSLLPRVVFVALKNGMHQSTGFAFFTKGASHLAPLDGSHVKELHGTIIRFLDPSQSDFGTSGN
jgi:hypothetical protein